MSLRDLESLPADLEPLGFVKRQIPITLELFGKNERDEKQIERAIGDLPQPLKAQRRQIITRQKLVGDRHDSSDVGLDRIGHRAHQKSIDCHSPTLRSSRSY